MLDSQRPESATSHRADGSVAPTAQWAPDLLVACLRHQLHERPDGDELAAAVELIMGLVYFNGTLLVLREEETGTPTRETVQELALEFARH